MFAQRAAARAAKPVAAARSLATVSSLGKRTTLANVQSDSSTSSLTLVLKAGSRFEPTQGAAAVLKNSAFKVHLQHSLARSVRLRSRELVLTV
jgi:ubiquinol-cytochrome c reductase core subunit 2